MTYRCPMCGSVDIRVAQDATAYYRQVDGAMVLQDVDAFDTIYALSCEACKHGIDRDRLSFDDMHPWIVD